MNSSHISDSSTSAQGQDSAAMRAWIGRKVTSLLVSKKFFVFVHLVMAANLFFDIEFVWGAVLALVVLAFAGDVRVRMKNARARRAV